MKHGWARLLCVGALLLCGAESDKKPAPPPGTVSMTAQQQHTVGLATAQAMLRPISEPVRVPGTVAFDPDRVAVLRPLAPERVMQLLVQPGATVQAGQALAKVQIPTLLSAEENLTAARASAVEAQTSVAVARDSLRRGEILARDGSLARAEAERRRLVLAQAAATLDADRSRVAALQQDVEQLSPDGTGGIANIVSPINGVVAALGVTTGEYVDTATSSFTIADLSVVMALAQIPEDSAPLISVGDTASVQVSGAVGRSWTGQVVSLAAALDPQSRTLPARVLLDNADGSLRAGMALTVIITSHRGRSGLVVPADAVQFLGDRRVAFTPAGGGRFQSHDLKLGVQQPDWVEVRQGLAAGDEVVTKGSFELKTLLQEQMLQSGG